VNTCLSSATAARLDPLLAQLLMASTYLLEVVQAARWSKANPKVTDFSWTRVPP